METDKRALLCVRLTRICPELEELLNAAAAGWKVFHAANLTEARLLAQRYRPTVGLMVLGGASFENVSAEVEQFLIDEKHTEWVGLVQPQQVDGGRLCEFIALYFYDFHSLPIDSERLCNVLGHAHGMAKVRRASVAVGQRGVNAYGMIGSSRAMTDVFAQIDKIASVDASVSISGESGTGKELAAKAIHDRSKRADKAFVAVNCGAIPASLIQSELFGHEKGAYTGAHKRHVGRIEAANGGTIFLDEIGDLPLDLQVTLLRFLQERTIERVGSTEAIPIDVRVITATHEDIKALVRSGRFREDLYFRLHVLSLRMPALRDRREDIEPIAQYYLQAIATQCHRRVAGFSTRALQSMTAHHWPGNVRELINKVHRAVVMSEHRLLSVGDLGLDGSARRAPDAVVSLAQARMEAERQAMSNALQHTGNNVTEAARQLGISRVSFYRIMEKLRLSSQ